MKNITRLIIIAAAACSLTSCFKDPDYILTNDHAFATVKNGELAVDTGVTYVVVEDKTDAKWKNEHRIFINEDILRLADQGKYEVRLLNYAVADERSVVVKSTVPEESIGKEPVSFHQGWGFVPDSQILNISYAFAAKVKDPGTHTTDLVFDDVRSAANDTVFLYLKHNGSGEVLTEATKKEFEIVMGYACIDLGKAFEGRSKTVPLCIEYDWYTSDSDGKIGDTPRHSAITGLVNIK